MNVRYEVGSFAYQVKSGEWRASVRKSSCKASIKFKCVISGDNENDVRSALDKIIEALNVTALKG